MAEPENAESIVQFDAEEYEEHQENPNQETPTEFPKSDIKQYFTFDDVPRSKWRERSIKMLPWCTAELQYYTIAVVIKRFLTRLQGRLRDWYHKSLGNEAYRALEKKFLAEFKRTGKCLGTACDDKYLQIKCKVKLSCDLEPVDVSDLESLYSLDDEPSDSVLCTIAYSDFSSDDDSDTDSLESDSDFGVHMINPIPHVLPIQEDPPLPLAKVHLLTDAYAKPIPVIAFFDTGSSVSILNPNILPDHYWKPHHQNFMAANGEKFLGIKAKIDKNTVLYTRFTLQVEGNVVLVLKNASFAFQKGNDTTSFEPILANTLVYINDILLFSPDEQSHAELLSKFYSLVAKYRIMLSEKKMEVGVTTIQFLAKIVTSYCLVVSHVKKNPPQWASRQTKAVKAIKCLAEKMPPLKIPASSEKRILQTDASDECWERSYLFKIIIIKDRKKDLLPTPDQQSLFLTYQRRSFEDVGDLTFEKRAKLCYKTFLTILLKNHGLCVKGLRFHPDYPFLNIFHIHDLWKFPKEALCFFYYLFESFTIGITFNAEKLLSYVVKSQFKDVPPHSKHLLTMLQWFVPHHQWTRWLTTTGKGTYVLVMFRRPGSFLPPRAVNDDGSDILVPGQDNAGNALLIEVYSNATPTCTYVPRQLSQNEIVKLLPEKWITNYEQIHQAAVRSTSAPEFMRHENGIHMITPTDQEPAQEVKHIWWDVYNCEIFLDEAAKIDDDEDLLKKRKSSQQKLKRRYEKGDPSVGLLGQPSGKIDYYVLYPKAEPSQPPSPPHKTPPSPYKPPPTSPPPSKLSPYNQKALSIHHQDSPIKNPTTIGPTGHANTISPAEAILNWQSENAITQNKVLVKILSQQGVITNSQEYLSSRVRSLESIINELHFKIQELHREIIQIIRTSPTTQPSSFIFQKEAEMKNLKNQLQDLEWLKPSTRKEPTFSQESQSIADVVASTKTPDDYEEFDNVESFEHLFMAEPENAKSTVQFDAEEYEEHQENPNQETPTEWRERSIEMLTWCTAELQYYTIDVVIKRFLTRLQGCLRDWYHSLGEYHQLQIHQSISPEAFMSIIYSEFIGSQSEHTTHAREEFLKMKCCSFQKKDLEKYYDLMSHRFYCLNGVDDVNLKQVFLNSFQESLRNEAYRALEARNVTIAQTTLGELYQLILNALAKLCNQKKLLAEFERTGKCLGTTCDDKYLYPQFSRRSIKKWKFIRKKKQRGRTSDRCFICQKRGHFARNYLDKKRSQALIQALNQVEPIDVSDLEFFYSLDDEPSDSDLCMIAYLDFLADYDSDTDSLESDYDFGVHMINPIPHVLPIQEDPPLPLAKVHLLTDAYAKPISVITFYDIGFSVSILNPNILPDHY
ncbi:hypothetical protein Tco_0525289 [Tanacetum coccineum]